MFHKEGHKFILLCLSITIIDILIVEYFIENSTLKIFIQIISLLIFLCVIKVNKLPFLPFLHMFYVYRRFLENA